MSSIASSEEIMLREFFEMCTDEKFNEDNDAFKRYAFYIYETLTKRSIRTMVEETCTERIYIFSSFADTTLQEYNNKTHKPLNQGTELLFDFSDKNMLSFVDAYEDIQEPTDIVSSLNRQTLDFSMGSVLLHTAKIILKMRLNSNPPTEGLSLKESIFLKYILLLLSSCRDVMHNIKSNKPEKITSLCSVTGVQSFKDYSKYFKFPSERTLNPVLFKKPDDTKIMDNLLQQNKPNPSKVKGFGAMPMVPVSIKDDDTVNFEDKVAETITRYLIACMMTIYKRVKDCTEDSRLSLFDATLLDLHTKSEYDY